VKNTFYGASLVLLFLAAPISQAAPLQWEEIKSLTSPENPTLKAASANAAASRAAVKESYGDFLPSVTLTAQRTRTVSEISVFETKTRNRTYSIGAAWNIFAGFATVAGVERARALESDARARRDLSSAELRYQLRRTFFSVYVQQERIRLFEKILKRQQQNEKLVSLKYDSGTEARWNVLKTKADRERAEFNLVAAKADLDSAREQLARYLYLESLPARPVDASALARAPIPNLSAGENRATVHPELKVSEASESRFSAERRLARSAFLPSLDLTYSRGRDQNEMGARTRTDSNTVAAVARWNIFSGFANYHNVQRANLAREAAELESQGVARRILSDLRTAHSALTLAQNRLPSAQSLREAAEERVKTVSAQYRSGLKTYLDWEQAEAQLLETEQQEVTALGGALNAIADFERASGITLEEP
jgi:outer membrane protein TolC